MRPRRWSMPPRRRTVRHSSTSGGSRKKSPDSIACEMHTMSCGTTRPAPRLRWPTSLFPICPSGSPTASPDASSSVRGAFAQRRCQVGVSPSSTALPARPGRKPQPSSTIKTTGVRGPCLFAIFRTMQSSGAYHTLPVVLSLALPALVTPLPSQARLRVTTDGAWFYQESGGKRLARLARGALLGGDGTPAAWLNVTLEGWIFATSVGPAPAAHAGFDFVVTRIPEENLRSAPAGALVAKLPQGFLLAKVDEGSSERWVHVTRAGWVQTVDVEPVAPVVRTHAIALDTGTGGLTPGRPGGPAAPAGDSLPGPA